MDFFQLPFLDLDTAVAPSAPLCDLRGDACSRQRRRRRGEFEAAPGCGAAGSVEMRPPTVLAPPRQVAPASREAA